MPLSPRRQRKLEKRHAKKRRRDRNGLRARLTRNFAMVAVLAVVLTTFATVDAAFKVIAKLNPELGLMSADQGGDPIGFQWSWPEVDPSAPAPTGAVATLLAQRREMVRSASAEITRSAVRSAFISALLAVIVAALVTRQLTQPLGRLVVGAQRLQAGERDLQLPVPRRRDELRDLTAAFNDLTTSLARQEAWRRGLIADVAHDLRTPLAVLRSEIEAMQDGVQPTDAAALTRLHSEVLLLARLVTDLRLLSLAESGALSLKPVALDGGHMLHALADAYTTRAAGAGITLEVLTPRPAPLVADPDRLTQTLRNILDNALRYAAPGAVTLSTHQDGPHTRLTIRDHGPGFRPDDLSRAFERFYRADASRTRDPQGRASSGLGLAIARALTEAQGGHIEARNHPGGGAEFTLTFPAGA
ncbi:ATP-binding protein [Deinococcus oregonensis]|uniref:histidine kinase n=1 Tax=Deinococcus oregonensis TaxID=1805970 RepID=A0ABV6B2D9_9DEIO